MEYIENIPDRDLTNRKRLIRCKECKYWDEGHTEECENSDSVCFHNGWCSPDFYCGDGEPKDGEQE